MWQKYNIDSKRAQRLYFGRDGGVQFYFSDDDFAAYSPAYLESNENVAGIINCLNPAGKTALSVVGGGDVPLFLSGYGARAVDTFDISFNAYIVMRIKMNLLQDNAGFVYYKNLFNKLSESPDFTESMVWPIIRDVFKKDKYIVNYLKDMNGCEIFDLPYNPYWTMDVDEYTKIKKSVPKSYRFIWADLYELPKRIGRRKYDIIYLSNILQYAGDNKKIEKIVNELHSHLNKNGTIVLDSLNPVYNDEYEFLNDSQTWGQTFYDANAASVFFKSR